ncbi:MAG: lytic transglycosylase domain-containing protein [Pseudomonadota bacterium]
MNTASQAQDERVSDRRGFSSPRAILRRVLRAAGVHRVSPKFRRVLRIQTGLVTVALCASVIVGATLRPPETLSLQLAMPHWSDGTVTFDAQVLAFAERVRSGYGVKDEVAREFAPWILEAAVRQNLAPELLAGLVLTESSFRKEARSSVGAIGPAQVRPDYWSQFCGTANLEDPEENIYCGAQILAHYLDRCGALDCALESYNVGPYGDRAQAGQRYVTKVDRHRLALVNAAI